MSTATIAVPVHHALSNNSPTGYGLGSAYALSVILGTNEPVAALVEQIQAVYDDDSRAPAGHFVVDATTAGTAITFLRDTGEDEGVIGKELTRSNAACQLSREFEPAEGDADSIYKLHAELLAQVDFDPSEIAEEGWQFGPVGGHGTAQIQRAEGDSTFCCDGAAVAYVRSRGLEGSLRHMEVFALHRWGATLLPDILKVSECACGSATADLCCPECKSDNIHVVVGECDGEAVFADAGFDGRAPAMCGDCGHKGQAASFAGQQG